MRILLRFSVLVAVLSFCVSLYGTLELIFHFSGWISNEWLRVVSTLYLYF
jgi:hypothetical protein